MADDGTALPGHVQAKQSRQLDLRAAGGVAD
jgi:hypothetical protein